MPVALYANCFPPAGVTADLMVTDEASVARAAAAEPAIRIGSPERSVDAELAHRTSLEMWRLAFSWFRAGGEDASIVEGVSAADLGGVEAAITIFGPAARGTLAMAAFLDGGAAPERVISVVPEQTPGGELYDQVEHVAADAADAAARHLTGGRMATERIVSTDPRNVALRDKYARTRDAQFLLESNAVRLGQRLVCDAAARLAWTRRRPRGSLFVVEYNPTAAFSRAYTAAPGPRRRLVRSVGDPWEIPAATLAGDIVVSPPTLNRGAPRHPVAQRLARADDALAGGGFAVAGVPLWPLIRPRVLTLVDRYARFAETEAPRLRAQLQRWDVRAVLVPFDTIPAARLLVRVAQSLGIPTLVVNDGYKGDEIQVEGMSTDVALAWSAAIAEHYYNRHPGPRLVTGNPRFASRPAPVRRPLPAGPLRVLVGTFTFSGIDLNCRRSDPEYFLAEVLEGLAAALPDISPDVMVKLHPADEPAHYLDLVNHRPELNVTLRSTGDVLDMLAEADVYLTTYSTSLLEAAGQMPIIYYRVNEQRIGPPFDGDAFLEPRTAATPAELCRRLRDRALMAAGPPDGWLGRYLGPSGATERITAAIETAITSGSRGAGARTALNAVPRQ